MDVHQDKDRDKIYTQVFDFKIQVNTMKIDDSYVQAEDITKRKRNFLSAKNPMKYEWEKEILIDK